MFRIVIRNLSTLADVFIGSWHATAQESFDEFRHSSQRWMLRSHLLLIEVENGCRSRLHSMSLSYE